MNVISPHTWTHYLAHPQSVPPVPTRRQQDQPTKTLLAHSRTRLPYNLPLTSQDRRNRRTESLRKRGDSNTNLPHFGFSSSLICCVVCCLECIVISVIASYHWAEEKSRNLDKEGDITHTNPSLRFSPIPICSKCCVVLVCAVSKRLSTFSATRRSTKQLGRGKARIHCCFSQVLRCKCCELLECVVSRKSQHLVPHCKTDLII